MDGMTLRQRAWCLIVAAALAAPGAARTQEGPRPAITLALDAPDVIVGETSVRLAFTLSTDAHVLVLRLDTDGRVHFVFPATPAADTLLPGGTPIRVAAATPARGATSFVIDEYPGVGYLFAIASRAPLRLEPYQHRGRWNRHALMPAGRVRGDPYVAFADLLDQLHPDDAGAYGFDVLPYAVGSRFDVPRFSCYGCHDDVGYPWRDSYQAWCGTFRIDVLAGLWTRSLLPPTLALPAAQGSALPAAIFVYARRSGSTVPPAMAPDGFGAAAGALLEGMLRELAERAANPPPSEGPLPTDTPWPKGKRRQGSH
jgi:hypothetical protein